MRTVRMTAANGRPEISEAGRNYGCQIAGSINPNVHCASLSRPAAWDPAPGLQPVIIMVILLMDLATDGKYMYRRTGCPACGLGFYGGISGWVLQAKIGAIKGCVPEAPEQRPA